MDILGGEVRSRIYINEHLPLLCRKLNSLCSKLKKNGKINKVKTFNKDLPKVSVTANDGAVISYELYTLLNRTIVMEASLERSDVFSCSRAAYLGKMQEETVTTSTAEPLH
uniref:Uncharacterized protein n=1 Tax=Glossina palpalis gambiensis TaxID=67801 RepID=A0A1B0BCG3_9MUSC